MNQLENLREQCAKMAENIVLRLSYNDMELKVRDVLFLFSRLKEDIAEDIRAIPLLESPDVPQSRIKDHPFGEWFTARSIDEMSAFYFSRLSAIRKSARELGYAIGLHGTARRDFDLMAVAWTKDCATPEELAHAIAASACGITRGGSYEWETKPQGRVATSIPICCTDHSSNFDKNALSLGHIDLSVVGHESKILPEVTVGISLQDEYDTLKAQLESAIATISDNEDGYLTLEKLTAEIVAKQYDQIEALQKENARLQELATTKQDANSLLHKDISLSCNMSEREKFEAVMRRDDSPLNNEVPFDSEIMEAAWFSWNAAVVTKVQLQSSTLKDSEGRVICKCDGTDQILAEIRELKEQLNKPKAQAVPGTNEATRKVLTARLEKVYADNKNIKATRLSDIERIVLMLTEAAIYTLNSIEDKA